MEYNDELLKIKIRMKIIKEDSMYTQNEKQTILQIMQTYFEHKFSELKINDKKQDFSKMAHQYMNETYTNDFDFENINFYELAKNTVLESVTYKKMLEDNPNYSFDYNFKYAANQFDADKKEVIYASRLLEIQEEIKKMKDDQIEKTARSLSSVVGKNNISRYNENGILDSSNSVIVQTNKSKEEYLKGYSEILKQINEISLICPDASKLLNEMVREVFEYYTLGLEDIVVKNENKGMGR